MSKIHEPCTYTAAQAIIKIANDITPNDFMGLKCDPVNFNALEMRNKLQEMCEQRALSPKQYWIALNATSENMTVKMFEEEAVRAGRVLDS